MSVNVAYRAVLIHIDVRTVSQFDKTETKLHVVIDIINQHAVVWINSVLDDHLSIRIKFTLVTGFHQSVCLCDPVGAVLDRFQVRADVVVITIVILHKAGKDFHIVFVIVDFAVFFIQAVLDDHFSVGIKFTLIPRFHQSIGLSDPEKTVPDSLKVCIDVVVIAICVTDKTGKNGHSVIVKVNDIANGEILIYVCYVTGQCKQARPNDQCAFLVKQIEVSPLTAVASRDLTESDKGFPMISEEVGLSFYVSPLSRNGFSRPVVAFAMRSVEPCAIDKNVVLKCVSQLSGVLLTIIVDGRCYDLFTVDGLECHRAEVVILFIAVCVRYDTPAGLTGTVYGVIQTVVYFEQPRKLSGADTIITKIIPVFFAFTIVIALQLLDSCQRDTVLIV